MKMTTYLAAALALGSINSTQMAGPWPSVNNEICRYDIHVYFDAEDQKDVKSAEALQKEIKKKFPEISVYPMVHEAIGPHAMPMFEAHIDTAEQFGRIVPWLCLNHKHHSVLIHPYHNDKNMGGYDHTRYPLWLGKQLKINTAIFAQFNVPV